VRKTLKTDKSDLENTLGHAVGLQIAGYFAVDPPLENRIKHIVCDDFSCGKQKAEEKIVSAVLSIVFFRRRSPFRPKSHPFVLEIIRDCVRVFWFTNTFPVRRGFVETKFTTYPKHSVMISTSH
jgi:hypothetical protein